MKQEYLVTGKMSDGNDYSHTVIATTTQEAIEKAMYDWSQEVDSIYYYFTEIKATLVSDRIDELEADLKRSKYVNIWWSTLTFILIALLIVEMMWVK